MVIQKWCYNSIFFLWFLSVLLQVGASIETFLGSLEPGQPLLFCVGKQKNKIKRFYVMVDHKAFPCEAQTSLAAFDELFKAHFVFSINYHESLKNFYMFIQITVFNIDVGSAKESPRVPVAVSPWFISGKDITFEMWTAGMFFVILHLVRFQETPY